MNSFLACVASVSNRVIERMLEWQQKKMEGLGGGEKRKHLTARKERSQYNKQITRFVKFTLFSNKTHSTQLQKL